MNKKTAIIIGAIALMAIIGGVYTLINDKDDKMMAKVEMEQQEATKDIGMMEKKEATMKDDATKTNNMTDKNDSMMKTGSYEAYTPEKVMLASTTHDVVLFFRANWCPTCKAVDADIKANVSKIPSSLSILDVNYDDSIVLKKKYGVTYQHTFVQVDKNGNLIKKWSGSPTLAALIVEVK
jgi:thiol-disulfide isomerase/thioredoxin